MANIEICICSNFPVAYRMTSQTYVLQQSCKQLVAASKHFDCCFDVKGHSLETFSTDDIPGAGRLVRDLAGQLGGGLDGGSQPTHVQVIGNN